MGGHKVILPDPMNTFSKELKEAVETYRQSERYKNMFRMMSRTIGYGECKDEFLGSDIHDLADEGGQSNGP